MGYSGSFYSKFRSSILSFIQKISWTNPFALTLTFKQVSSNKRLDEISTSESVRHFMNRLNRSLFGNATKRYGKGLKLFPVIERSADNRFHVHAIIDCPKNIEFFEFEEMVRLSIQSIDFGYNELDIQPIRDDGWSLYITKFDQKSDYPLSIDWMNVRTD